MRTPDWLLRIRRNSAVRSLGKGLERGGKQLVHKAFRVFFKANEVVNPEAMADVRKIILLRPNYRIGNTLISMPLVLALRERFPAASLDYLGTDATAVLLKNLPINRVLKMSRSFIMRPWKYLSLLHYLNRQKYDLAVQCGCGSFSETICMCATNARYRLGAGKWAEGVCNITAAADGLEHEYDGPVVIARKFGAACLDRPTYAVSEAERESAVARLSAIGYGDGKKVEPFAALFVGGHKAKRWPAEYWEELVQALLDNSFRARILVLLGPEEVGIGARLRASPVFRNINVLDPIPLRDFAAVLERAAVMIAPDTGPMHLAAALNVPTVALLKSRASQRYAPRGANDVTLVAPTVEQVLRSLRIPDPATA